MDVQKVVFMLMAQEMDRAIAFYRDVIGLELRLHEGNWAELGHDDAVVALHGGGNGEYRSTGLGFTVADVAAACEEVSAAGGGVIQVPRGTRRGRHHPGPPSGPRGQWLRPYPKRPVIVWAAPQRTQQTRRNNTRRNVT